MWLDAALTVAQVADQPWGMADRERLSWASPQRPCPGTSSVGTWRCRRVRSGFTIIVKAFKSMPLNSAHSSV